MGDRNSRMELWFLALAAALAVALVVGTILTWTDPVVDAILLGIATSFIFVIITDLAFRARAWFSETRPLREFFGVDLVSRTAYAMYVEFELQPAVEATLRKTHGTRYWRKADDHASEFDRPIEFTHAVAGNDIEAILDVAAILRARSEPLVFLRDQDFPRRRESQDAMSLIAPGLTANAAVKSYLDRGRGRSRDGDDPSRLFSLHEHDEHPMIRVADGPGAWRTFHGTPARMEAGAIVAPAEQFGIILRYSPSHAKHPDTRWIIVAGLERIGTPAAAVVLRRHWNDMRRLLGREHRSADFLAVVQVDIDDPDTRDREDFAAAVQSARLVHLVVGPSAAESTVLALPPSLQG